MSDHRKRPSDFSQAATLDFKRDHWFLEGVKRGQYQIYDGDGEPVEMKIELEGPAS